MKPVDKDGMESSAFSEEGFRFASPRAVGVIAMYGSIHGHDDDFLFEQQRDRHDSWFQTVVYDPPVRRESGFFQPVEKEVAAPAVETPAKDDSLRDVARDAARLFRRLIQLAFKRKPTS
jgi:hypothetical protein